MGISGQRQNQDGAVVSVADKRIAAAGETCAAITLALKHDVSALELFDEHDPLGLAFYIHAIVECSYMSFETNELAEAGRLWAVEKLTGETSLSVYKDRDVGAIALLVYSFRGLPNDRRAVKFADFVRPFIDPAGSVFSSFFCSALVGLALRHTDPADETTSIVAEYLNQQLTTRYSVVANDAKNLLLAYWWARDSHQQSLLAKLNLSAKDIIAEVQPNLDALVFAAFILLEQAESFSRRERAPIKAAAENAITSIEAYTKESLSPGVALTYEQDLATLPDDSRRSGLEGKPRLSRILIAVGLMLQRSYLTKSPLLLSSKARGLQITRAVLVSIVLLFLTWVVWWIADKVGLPADAKTPLRSHHGLQMAQGILLFVGNTVLGTLVLVMGFWIWRFVADLGIYGRCQDELEVLSRGWGILVKNFWIAIALPLMTNFVVTFMT
jgi:hypothetical protein